MSPKKAVKRTALRSEGEKRGGNSGRAKDVSGQHPAHQPAAQGDRR